MLLFFSIILALPGYILPFHINFAIRLLTSTKYLARIWGGNLLHLQIKLGRNDILTVFSFSMHEHVISFHLLDLCLLSLEFYNFPHVNLVHILLDIYLSTLFFLGAIMNDSTFLISIAYCWYIGIY